MLLSQLLQEACWNGDIQEVHGSIEWGAKMEEVGIVFGKAKLSPLVIAATRGHAFVVWMLLEKGAKVNADRSAGSLTPLIAASQEGHSPIVQILLNHNADINKHDFSFRTALFHACQLGLVDVLRLLLCQGCDVNGKKSALLKAVEENRIEWLSSFLSMVQRLMFPIASKRLLSRHVDWATRRLSDCYYIGVLM